MSRIPAHLIDEIMNTARIEEVIGEYVQLKKAGSNFKGLSPFTEEKTPSFVVSPAKQIFKCFSTGKGGTVVSFLMELEQFSYPEALRWLAERYNISLPESKPLTPEEQLELTERESLQIVNTFARDFFVDTIKNSKEGKLIGYSYFKERGYTSETIERFELGYCPKEEKSLTETALEKGYKQVYLEKLGLTKTSGERRFDFFSGRVIFPIHSVSGKVLGFGGRILGSDKKIAKYFNSPESILYDKSKILYGMYFAKNEVIKQDNCLLVEGYTDVISLFQAGVENVVSSSGTSLTTGQIKLIQRYTQNITVLYDSDNAGIKASFRGIDLLLEEGMTVKVLLLPEGEDPDSFSKSVSGDELKEYIQKNQKDFVGFKTEVLLEGAEGDPIKQAELIKEIVGSIALIPDEITRSVYIKEVSNQFEMDESTLLNELNKIRRRKLNSQRGIPVSEEEIDISQLQTKPKTTAQSDSLKRDFYSQEYDLARILVLYGDRAIEVQEENEKGEKETFEISVAELIVIEMERDHLVFFNPLFDEIYQIYKEALEADSFFTPEQFLRLDNPEVLNFVTDILTPRYELSKGWLEKHNIETAEEIHKVDQMVREAIYSFKISIIMRQTEDLQEKIKEAGNTKDESLIEYLTEIVALEKVKQKLSKQLGRIVF
ncbi:MAG TPA: DNA primase [Brumimicrobium sp.]|nr:DNA primase [Brumimicrobium sp.]